MTEQEIVDLGLAFAARLRRSERASARAEQVCRALNQWCGAVFRRWRGISEVRHTSEVIRCTSGENAEAAKSHKN